MTPRRALLALSLVAMAANAAADPSQSAPAPQTTAPPQPTPPPPSTTTPPATRSATPDETAIDPLAIAFDVSPDHDAVDAAGPKLVKYVIDFVPPAGAPGKTYTLDLGKPKPVEGAISVPLNKVLEPGTYMAHVRAIGRGLYTTTVTVGPFVITEKIGKTKADIDKELRAPDKPQPQDKRTKKPKEPQPKEPPQTQPPAAPPQTESGNEGKDSPKPTKKGFWKKAYEKVVGDPMASS
jgi:hypothetical protein